MKQERTEWKKMEQKITEWEKMEQERTEWVKIKQKRTEWVKNEIGKYGMKKMEQKRKWEELNGAEGRKKKRERRIKKKYYKISSRVLQCTS